MTARRGALWGVFAVLTAFCSIAAGSHAGAAAGAEVTDVGWWSRTHQEPTLGPVLAAPTVVPGQLVVEGTTEGATAIAAIRATLPDGTGAPVLTLRVASDAGGENANLLACQAGSGWAPAHAGSWEEKPSPDCERSVTGIRAEDGSAWSFALAPLLVDQALDVVLTPGVDPDLPDGLNGSAFRLVFERPAGSDIEVGEQASADPDFDAPDVEFAPPATSATGGSDTMGPPTFGGDTSGSPTFSLPATDEQVAPPARSSLPSDEQGVTDSAPGLRAPEPLEGAAAAAAGDGDGGRALGALVVLVGLGFLAWSTTQPVPERQLLSRFAAHSGGTTTSVLRSTPASDRIGGLGRFKRVRSTPARRLGG